MICKTAGELIAALKIIDPETVVFSTEPPFNCVKLVQQGNGKLLICADHESAPKYNRPKQVA